VKRLLSLSLGSITWTNVQNKVLPKVTLRRVQQRASVSGAG
jgi:hypothetical protein